MDGQASAIVQSGRLGVVQVVHAAGVEQRGQLRVEPAAQVGRVGVDEALAAGGVDEDVPVGVVDVVGERLAGAPVVVGRLLLGDDLVAHAEGLPEGREVGRGAGP